MCLSWFKNLGKSENYKLKMDYAENNLTYTRITSDDMRYKMMDIMGIGVQYIILDRYFWTVNMAHIVWFLEHDDTDTYKYIHDDGINQQFDCDNFAIRLWGNMNIPNWACIPFGIIIIQTNTGGMHMMNIYIDEDMEIWAIEPQNDAMYTMQSLILSNWKPVLVMM
jgi:hypothetical protein